MCDYFLKRRLLSYTQLPSASKYFLATGVVLGTSTCCTLFLDYTSKHFLVTSVGHILLYVILTFFHLCNSTCHYRHASLRRHVLGFSNTPSNGVFMIRRSEPTVPYTSKLYGVFYLPSPQYALPFTSYTLFLYQPFYTSSLQQRTNRFPSFTYLPTHVTYRVTILLLPNFSDTYPPRRDGVLVPTKLHGGIFLRPALRLSTQQLFLVFLMHSHYEVQERVLPTNTHRGTLRVRRAWRPPSSCTLFNSRFYNLYYHTIIGVARLPGNHLMMETFLPRSSTIPITGPVLMFILRRYNPFFLTPA